MSTILKQLRSALRVSTPLIAIRTADPGGLVKTIAACEELYVMGAKKNGRVPILQWDIVNGLRAVERAGDAEQPSTRALELLMGSEDASVTTNPTESLIRAGKAPASTLIFWHNAHRFINDDPGISQAIWNLRDVLKEKNCALIMLAPSFTLPAELQQDVLILDEALPTDTQLTEIATRIYDEFGLPAPDAPTTEHIIDATLGLAMFPAEQSMAMSLTKKNGMNLPELWERKRQVIESSQGLSVWRGTETFADIGGLDNLKQFLTRVKDGRNPPRAIVFLDEIEKAIGTGQDTSGVSQGMLGQLLTWMQDRSATGILLVGPPGVSKSAIAKAAGNEAGIPTIALDLGGMKGSLVGESEARFRNALKVIDAVSQGRALFIATCNSLAILPPELKRRFTFGTYYMDLPSTAERAAIWDIYRRKYEIAADDPAPDDAGWTGAEIKQAAELAWRLNQPLRECANYIVPVSKSAADRIEKLRSEADGRFISASYPGVFRLNKQEAAQAATGRRAVQFQPEDGR